MAFKRSALAAAIAASCAGVAASPASADTVDMSFEGWFTWLDASGSVALVNSDATSSAMHGNRTPIAGSLTFDTSTGTGSASMDPFSFLGNVFAPSSMTLQSIGNGQGGNGPLLLGNMLFDYSGTVGIPLSIVWDASGLFGAMNGGLTTSDTISGVGSAAATDDFLFISGKSSYTLPMGPIPIATTTWNTTDIGTIDQGTYPSGTVPLTDDGIGGSPMKGPYTGYNLNFDFTGLEVVSVSTVVPVPAAVWLFGSGLIGLIGVARRK